jgi:putative membrane-bound dehydrogenase-like protein
MTRWIWTALLLAPQELQRVEDLGLRVAPGFKVTLTSDPAIANDIYSMTLDAKGRIVVTSQGWIRILHDRDGDGKADEATLFAETRTGGMGMCFDGNDLLFAGDGGLWRYRDAEGDGKADGPPERIAKFTGGEHGHHAIRKGPDGSWYFIAGNDAKVGKEHVTLPNSPVREPETGAIVRFTPDLSKSEVIAHGFRNPYDFDFNEAGDLFCYDSDCERDYFLPWYTPTRIYHVGYGMHHGWRLTGYQRSFARPDFYPDNVDVLWPIGRGSPTGVSCYRHDQFPERYRGGIFALDWTFGRVWFLPLKPEGASYTTQAEVFIEPAGTEGFAPTDACVAPDGSLYVSIGGRRTRGAVYKVEYAGPPVPRRAAPRNDLEAVLHAPQPLDAWSRAKWEPLARRLGAQCFDEALVEKGSPPAERARAVEVLTELFGGPRLEVARAAAGLPWPEVRARLAWSLGRGGGKESAEILQALARDSDPRVRRAALESVADLGLSSPEEALANFGHPDKRVRQAAARLAKQHPQRLPMPVGNSRALLTHALSDLWRGDPAPPLDPLLLGARDSALWLEAVRLIALRLGDANLHRPPIEVHSMYSLTDPVSKEMRERILKAVRPIYPSGDARLDQEAGRLLAMLEDEDDATVAKTAAFLTEKSHPTQDVHTLCVLSRLKGTWPPELAGRVAHAVLSLNRKLEGQEQRTKQTWNARIAELVGLFLKRDPRFAGEILKSPALVSPGHVGIAAALGDRRPEAARLFLAAAGKDDSFPWSEALIELLSQLPDEDFLPVLRAQWSNYGLRDAIVLRLAQAPAGGDREKYLAGAESANAQVVRASLDALERIGPGERPRDRVPLLRLLRRLILEPREAALRRRVTALLGAGEVREEGTDPATLKRAYEPLFEKFVRENPADRAELEGSDPAAAAALLKSVEWERGDAKRGEEVFRARGCQTCHAVQGALGPSLAGAAGRFSREDLFQAVLDPNRDVAPLYRTTAFLLKNGQVHTGIVAFESADGYIVQTGATTTVRIAEADIQARRPSASSLMPADLLKGLAPGDLADLYAYLRSLK